MGLLSGGCGRRQEGMVEGASVCSQEDVEKVGEEGTRL